MASLILRIALTIPLYSWKFEEEILMDMTSIKPISIHPAILSKHTQTDIAFQCLRR